MRFVITVILGLIMAEAAQAKLSAGPWISSVALDQHDPNMIYVRLKNSPCKAALSTNGGLAFQEIDEQKIPTDLSTNLSPGARRYVLIDSYRLLRSDDGGVTWTNTAATLFLRDQKEKKQRQYWEKYGARLPDRSDLWQPLFGLFACGYFLLTIYMLRAQGWLQAVWEGLRGVVIIFLVWCLLRGFHTAFKQLGGWYLDELMPPSPKLGLAMAITARPLPLLVYLLALWPLLPGSLRVLSGCVPPLAQKWHRLALGVAIAVGASFVAFNLYMALIGNFWE